MPHAKYTYLYSCISTTIECKVRCDQIKCVARFLSFTTRSTKQNDASLDVLPIRLFRCECLVNKQQTHRCAVLTNAGRFDQQEEDK